VITAKDISALKTNNLNPFIPNIMKHKIKKLCIAFALFVSLPFTSYSRNCGCKETTLTSGWGYEWTVADNTPCCSGNGGNVFLLTAVRNRNGDFTTLRTQDTLQNARTACC
jgi:hypothetical protein